VHFLLEGPGVTGLNCGGASGANANSSKEATLRGGLQVLRLERVQVRFTRRSRCGLRDGLHLVYGFCKNFVRMENLDTRIPLEIVGIE
jgi:hypothetical protein